MAALNRVDGAVLAAVLAGSSRVTRRLEIFEADGETSWMGSDDTPRMIEGSITVDYSRAERRAIDVTLDNGDGVLDHDPDGFWYDKVLKVYRGIEYQNTKLLPSVGVIRDEIFSGSESVVGNLRQMGFVDIKQVDASSMTVEALSAFDVVVANSSAHVLTTDESALLRDLYATGTTNILTMGNDNGHVQLPFVTASFNKLSSETWSVNRTPGDNPLSRGWSSYVCTGDTDTGVSISGISSTAIPIGTMMVGAVETFTAIIDQNINGARWFHYQPRLLPSSRQPARRLLLQAMNWLYTYTATRKFETQVGEFQIDSIKEDHFPRHIKVTGRDYTKKLLGAKLEQSVTFTAGTTIDQVVRAIAANGGVTKTLLSSNGAFLKSDISFDRSTERWKVISDMCTASGVEVYFNRQGYLTTREFIDPTTAPTSLILKTGEPDGNLASYTKSSSDARIRNVVVVAGENQDDLGSGNVWQGKAINTEPSSPTRVERLGERHEFYASPFLRSDAECEQLAQQMLKVMALEDFQLDFTSIAFPWLEVGEVAGFIDPRPGSGEPDRFLLTNLTIPLTLGPMSGTGKRITIVGQGSTPGV